LNARDLLQATRVKFVNSNTISPSVTIIYKRKETLEDIPYKAFAGGGEFNKQEKEKISNMEVFSSVPLDFSPSTRDKIEFDMETFSVRRWIKSGSVYNIYCEKSKSTKSNPKPSRRPWVV